MNGGAAEWEHLSGSEGNYEGRASGYALIVGYLGIIMILAGIITLLPLLTLIFYPYEADQAKYFIVPGVISILAGYLVSFVFLRNKKHSNMEKNQEMIVLIGTWIITIGVTAVPFVLTGNYSFTQAVFETTSGLSTTGLSVVDTAAASHIFLIHRSVLLFFGGIGLVLVMTSVLSDIYGMRFYSAEGHSDRLLPNLIESARLIIGIYSGYILGGILLYAAFGMNLFDAFNHSIAALSTGGFSTRPESIGYYDSASIEFITIVLMLLGSTNFFVHVLLLKGRLRDVLRHCETRLVIYIMAVSAPAMVVFLMHGVYNNISESFRVAVFQAVSALTTTGFQTIDSFKNWSSPLIMIMIILMLIGGGAGSTAGGIKLYRVSILAKQIKWRLMHEIYPGRHVFTESINRYGKEEIVSSREKDQVSAFAWLYLIVFCVGTLIFCSFGYSVQDSMFEFSSALSTVGLSVGITAYDANPLIHWTATAGMFLGRLELFAVMVGMARFFSDGRRFVHKIIKRQ